MSAVAWPAAPAANLTLAPRELHMEVMDARTLDVWLQQAPVTPEEFRAFRPEAPFVKSGVAHSAMDYASFRRLTASYRHL